MAGMRPNRPRQEELLYGAVPADAHVVDRDCWFANAASLYDSANGGREHRK